MATFFEEKLKAEKHVSEGTIGGKIKKYRELRGLTQKQLGILVGFKSTNADSRIAQYEMNSRVPSQKIVEKIAEGLNIEVEALYETDIIPLENMYHVLFDIGVYHGLHPVEIKGKTYLSFDEESIFLKKREYKDFLNEWKNSEDKYKITENDSPEEIERKKAEYALWMAKYPSNEGEKQHSTLEKNLKKEEYRKEIDRLTVEEKGEEVEKSIKLVLDDVLPSVKCGFEPIKYESEFILFLEKMLEAGINIEFENLEWDKKVDYGYIHMISIPVDDILDKKEKTEIYAYLTCIIQQLQDKGINIIQKIVCRREVLYITFKYSVKDHKYFHNFERETWELIGIIAQRKQENCSKEEYEIEEKTLMGLITGEKDQKI